MNKEPHVAQYGTVLLERRYCEDCKGFAFVVEGRIQCCDSIADKAPLRYSILMSSAPPNRKGPSSPIKKRILRNQKHCCFWCGRRFRNIVWRGQHKIILRTEWDHVVPFSYSRNNRESNFVASCQICNGYKGALIFNAVEECRDYIKIRWEEKKYSDMRPMWGELHRETRISKIL